LCLRPVALTFALIIKMCLKIKELNLLADLFSFKPFLLNH
jgi:hypothetical protein